MLLTVLYLSTLCRKHGIYDEGERGIGAGSAVSRHVHELLGDGTPSLRHSKLRQKQKLTIRDHHYSRSRTGKLSGSFGRSNSFNILPELVTDLLLLLPFGLRCANVPQSAEILAMGERAINTI
jgi:hypothetical protein